MLSQIAELGACMLSVSAAQQQIAAKQFINDVLVQYVSRKGCNVSVWVDRLDQSATISTL